MITWNAAKRQVSEALQIAALSSEKDEVVLVSCDVELVGALIYLGNGGMGWHAGELTVYGGSYCCDRNWAARVRGSAVTHEFLERCRAHAKWLEAMVS